ncbi:alpha/beta fold hydrolase [Hoyosella rhizosphaerae]|uniref:Alpha/beta hydrolase n=1 Tax=Hoyosella rhizosphaerae TaxID=1755582 RepID=A0A916UJP4_9ACTN|nr:alpha/beta fold hydrolase [Hoyosella rhizosphaerae]MBN4928425.1 alpha/beta fold hydrolase [Hoyosella rhizosphaerae]GGC74847.1 alpha/beta hydrolase [Hoyosella rhizosphaerae]
MIVVPVQMPDNTITPVRVFVEQDKTTGSASHEIAPRRISFLVIPGLGSPASYYDPLAQMLSDRGFPTAVTELRGQGASDPSPHKESEYGYHDLVTVDIPAALEVLRENAPEHVPVLIGHSLGGQLSCLYGARNPHSIGGIVLVGAGSPYFRGFPGMRALGPLVGGQMMSMTAQVTGYWPGDKVNLAGFGRQSRVLVRDWSRFARTGRIDPAGADINYESALSESSLHVLAVTVARDDIAPSTSVNNLVNKLEKSDVEHWFNSEPQGHNGWIRAPKLTVDRILQWLETKL